MFSIHSKVIAMAVYNNNDNITIEQDLSKNYYRGNQCNNFSNLEIAIKSHMANHDANFSIKYTSEPQSLHIRY
ncbi:MAG: hypothetical protein E7211_13570 [Clostridium lundense]|nr:hypothetical protein [Clostridium lundense]